MRNFEYAIWLIPSPFGKHLAQQITVSGPQLLDNLYCPHIRALTVQRMRQMGRAESGVESASSEE